jgi:hypothetical protein
MFENIHKFDSILTKINDIFINNLPSQDLEELFRLEAQLKTLNTDLAEELQDAKEQVLAYHKENCELNKKLEEALIETKKESSIIIDQYVETNPFDQYIKKVAIFLTNTAQIPIKLALSNSLEETETQLYILFKGLIFQLSALFELVTDLYLELTRKDKTIELDSLFNYSEQLNIHLSAIEDYYNTEECPKFNLTEDYYKENPTTLFKLKDVLMIQLNVLNCRLRKLFCLQNTLSFSITKANGMTIKNKIEIEIETNPKTKSDTTSTEDLIYELTEPRLDFFIKHELFPTLRYSQQKLLQKITERTVG